MYELNKFITMYVICCFAVRLVSGPTKYEGRVEVYHNGEWSTVCDDDWDLNDAQVVCTELGLDNAVSAPISAFYGEGRGYIWFHHVECVGTERTIRKCSYSEQNMGFFGYCYHSKDAGVKCSTGISKTCACQHVPDFANLLRT